MALEGSVSLPGGGKVPKKAAAAGLVITATLIGVYYYRKRQASSAAAAAPAASSSSQYPPDGTTGNPSDPYSTDPATGQTYGNEAAGSGGTFGAYGSYAGGGNYDPNSGLYYDPATGQYDLSQPYTGTTQNPAGGPPFADNSAWADWTIQQLVSLNSNTDVGALTDALGLYLEGQPVDPAQKTLIFDAIAVGGDPPVPGAGGYPPSVKTKNSGGPGHQATVTVPYLKGERVENATSALTALGLKAKFGPRKSGTAYTVTSSTPPAGRRVNEGSTVTLAIAPQQAPRRPGPPVLNPGGPEVPLRK